jgi:hypothetical protein
MEDLNPPDQNALTGCRRVPRRECRSHPWRHTFSVREKHARNLGDQRIGGGQSILQRTRGAARFRTGSVPSVTHGLI